MMIKDINIMLKSNGLLHEAVYVEFEDDDDTVDYVIEFQLMGVPTSLSIQCGDDGYYSPVEHSYEGEELSAHFYTPRKSLKAAVAHAVLLLKAAMVTA